MALFEVFIPGKEAGMPNVTLTVEAQNWIGALRSGLKSIGEGQEAIANVMCDIKEDNSIHVTDVATRRVFRLRETSKPAETPPAPKAAAKGPVDAHGDPQTIPEGPRPISMDADDDATLKNVRPPGVGEDLHAQPRTLIEFPMPNAASILSAQKQVTLPDPETSVAWTKMPGPASTASPAAPAAVKAPAAMPPVPASTQQAVVPAPVTNAGKNAPKTAPKSADTGVKSAKSGDGADTERIARPAKEASPPTPRGVPAPKPQRTSGQFSSAAAPKTREVSEAMPTDPRIGRVDTLPSAPSGATPVDVQDAIAAVFDATQDLYMQSSLSPQHVADKLLDIALAHIPADAGSFYIADVNNDDLVFAAVRGPKADAIKKSGVTVKVGQGIIGFCAQEGVCLLVNDIQKDTRFYAAIAKSIDYQPKDTLCASAEKDGRLWGAVQLINSKSGFDPTHMEVLRFIGLTAAAMLERIDAGRGG